MRLGEERTRALAGVIVVIGLCGLAGPVAADAADHACTVIVGTHATPDEGPRGASATTPAGGLGECKLHTLGERASIAAVDAPDGCNVYADVDEDAFTEGVVDVGEVYEPGTSFRAFCQVGVTMAENGIALADP